MFQLKPEFFSCEPSGVSCLVFLWKKHCPFKQLLKVCLTKSKNNCTWENVINIITKYKIYNLDEIKITKTKPTCYFQDIWNLFSLHLRQNEDVLTKSQSKADKMKVTDNTSKVKLRKQCAPLSLLYKLFGIKLFFLSILYFQKSTSKNKFLDIDLTLVFQGSIFLLVLQFCFTVLNVLSQYILTLFRLGCSRMRGEGQKGQPP